jgi:hypothetical protein
VSRLPKPHPTANIREMPKPSALYDQDFVLWTVEQATALRRAKTANLPLAWENLAEEIESLGKSDRRELTAQIRRILRHLLKLASSPATDPRAGWRVTIAEARTPIDSVIEDSPSLRREVDGLIAKQLPIAAKLAMEDLAAHCDAADAVGLRPAQGGFSAAEVLGDWFPPEPQTSPVG